VARDRRLRKLQRVVHLADADLAADEQRENAQPRRVREGLEQRFDVGQPRTHIFALTNIA
jgi:hypothetical protein